MRKSRRAFCFGWFIIEIKEVTPMIYVTGDTHGDLRRLEDRSPISRLLTPEDLIIVAGDFGYLLDQPSLPEHLGFFASRQYTVAFIDGNHEAFPLIGSFPEETWCGGRIHRILPNLIHLMRGQVYTIENIRIFTMGGAHSPDRAMRTPGVNWWPEELPSQKEYQEGLKNLEAVGHDIDAIISHTAPYDTLEFLKMRGYLDSIFPEDQPICQYLQYIDELTGFPLHLFGHLHLDLPLWRNQYALLNDIFSLNSRDYVFRSETV